MRNLIIGLVLLPLLSWGQATPSRTIPQNGGDFSANAPPGSVPKGVILVKGAWSSASDSVTPVPEDGAVTNNVYSNKYFSINFPLPQDWIEKYKGPPPSDTGRYVLAQLRAADVRRSANRGSILITAQDLFFTPLPASNTLEFAKYNQRSLQPDYTVELAPAQTKVANHPFTFYAYWSPVAQLHWYVLDTQIRCHAVEFVLTSRDTKLLENLILGMNRMTLPAEAGPTAGTGGDTAPVCIKDYAVPEHLTARVDPVFTEHRFNPVPVRIIIDAEGKVKHIHFLSAFPDQARSITDALKQWRFKPYVKDGRAVEVETGIMFGTAPRLARPSSTSPNVD